NSSLRKLKIEESHSKQMAGLRERYIEGVLEEILAEKKGGSGSWGAPIRETPIRA
ncbi:MAG: hypothetical protein HC813_00725, partial [Planctomycetes bacterium]|nr:hypothetical protein [Planctomycetota bacterium]